MDTMNEPTLLHWNASAIREAILADDSERVKKELMRNHPSVVAAKVSQRAKEEAQQARQRRLAMGIMTADAIAIDSNVVPSSVVSEYAATSTLASYEEEEKEKEKEGEDHSLQHQGTSKATKESSPPLPIREEDLFGAITDPEAIHAAIMKCHLTDIDPEEAAEDKLKGVGDAVSESVVPQGIPHVAAANGKFAVMEWVLAHAPESVFWAADMCKWPPLHYAAFNGHDGVCALLLRSNADRDMEDAYGETAGEIVSQQQEAASDGIVALLGEYGGGGFFDENDSDDQDGSEAGEGENPAERARRIRRRRRDKVAKAKQQSTLEERLSAQAKALVEDLRVQKLIDEQRAKEAAERRQVRRDLVAERRDARQYYENIRVRQQMDWLQARQRLAFEILCDREQLFRTGGLLFYYENVIEPALAANDAWRKIERAREEQKAREAQLAAEKARRRRARQKAKRGSSAGKGSPSSRASSAAPAPTRNASFASGLSTIDDTKNIPVSNEEKKPPIIAPHYRNLFYGLSFEAEKDFPIPEALLPGSKVFLSKPDKAKLTKQKNSSMRKRRENKELIAAAHVKLDALKAEERVVFESIEAVARKQLYALWLCEAATYIYFSFEPSIDRKHQHVNTNKLGKYLYNVETETYRWSCCGQRDDPCAAGCVAADDELRPRYHPGTYQYHQDDGSCCWHLMSDKEKRFAKKKLIERQKLAASSAASTRERGKAQLSSSGRSLLGARNSFARNGSESDDFDDADDDGVDQKGEDFFVPQGGTIGRSRSNRSTASERRRAQRSKSGGRSFTHHDLMLKHPNCHPSGYSWTCCGSTDPDEDGCTARKRLIYFRHQLLSAPLTALHLPTCLDDREEIYMRQWYPLETRSNQSGLGGDASENKQAAEDVEDRTGLGASFLAITSSAGTCSPRAGQLRPLPTKKTSRREPHTAFKTSGLTIQPSEPDAATSLGTDQTQKHPSLNKGVNWRRAFGSLEPISPSSTAGSTTTATATLSPISRSPQGDLRGVGASKVKIGALGRGFLFRGRGTANDPIRPSDTELSEQAARETHRRQKVFSKLRRQLFDEAGIGASAGKSFLASWDITGQGASPREERDADNGGKMISRTESGNGSTTPRVRPVTAVEMLRLHEEKVRGGASPPLPQRSARVTTAPSEAAVRERSSSRFLTSREMLRTRTAKNVATFVLKTYVRNKPADRALVLVLKPGLLSTKGGSAGDNLTASVDLEEFTNEEDITHENKSVTASFRPEDAVLASVLEFSLCGRKVRHLGQRVFLPKPKEADNFNLLRHECPTELTAFPGALGDAMVKTSTSQTTIFGTLAVQPYSLYEHVCLENKRRMDSAVKELKERRSNARPWSRLKQRVSIAVAGGHSQNDEVVGASSHSNKVNAQGKTLSSSALVIDEEEGDHRNVIETSVKVEPTDSTAPSSKREEEALGTDEENEEEEGGGDDRHHKVEDYEGIISREFARRHPLAPQTRGEYNRQLGLAGQIAGGTSLTGNASNSSRENREPNTTRANIVKSTVTADGSVEPDSKKSKAMSDEASIRSLVQRNSGGYAPFGSSALLYRPLRSNVVAFEFVIHRCPQPSQTRVIGSDFASSSQLVIGVCLRDLWWLGKDDWLRSKKRQKNAERGLPARGSVDCDEFDVEVDEDGDAPRQRGPYGNSPIFAVQRPRSQAGLASNARDDGSAAPNAARLRQTAAAVPLIAGDDAQPSTEPDGHNGDDTDAINNPSPRLSSRSLFELAMEKLWQDSMAEDQAAELARRNTLLVLNDENAPDNKSTPMSTIVSGKSSTAMMARNSLSQTVDSPRSDGDEHSPKRPLLPAVFNLPDPFAERPDATNLKRSSSSPSILGRSGRSSDRLSSKLGSVASVVFIDPRSDVVPPVVYHRRDYLDAKSPSAAVSGGIDSDEECEVEALRVLDSHEGKREESLRRVSAIGPQHVSDTRRGNVTHRRRSTVFTAPSHRTQSVLSASSRARISAALSLPPKKMDGTSQVAVPLPPTDALAVPMSVPEILTKNNMFIGSGGGGRPDDAAAIRQSVLRNALLRIIDDCGKADSAAEAIKLNSKGNEKTVLSMSPIEKGRQGVTNSHAHGYNTATAGLSSFFDSKCNGLNNKEKSMTYQDTKLRAETYEHELEALQAAMAAQCSIGWWAHTTHIRGLGGMVREEAKEAYGKENDCVAIVIDGPNNSIFFFKNRALVATVALPTRHQSAAKRSEVSQGGGGGGGFVELERRAKREEQFEREARRSRRRQRRERRKEREARKKLLAQQQNVVPLLQEGVEGGLFPTSDLHSSELSSSSESSSDLSDDFNAGLVSTPRGGTNQTTETFRVRSSSSAACSSRSSSCISSSVASDSSDYKESPHLLSPRFRPPDPNRAEFVGGRFVNYTPKTLLAAIEARLDPQPLVSLSKLLIVDGKFEPQSNSAQNAVRGVGSSSPPATPSGTIAGRKGNSSPLKNARTRSPTQQPTAPVGPLAPPNALSLRSKASIDFAAKREAFVSPMLAKLARESVLLGSDVKRQQMKWRCASKGSNVGATSGPPSVAHVAGRALATMSNRSEIVSSRGIDWAAASPLLTSLVSPSAQAHEEKCRADTQLTPAQLAMCFMFEGRADESEIRLALSVTERTPRIVSSVIDLLLNEFAREREVAVALAASAFPQAGPRSKVRRGSGSSTGSKQSAIELRLRELEPSNVEVSDPPPSQTTLDADRNEPNNSDNVVASSHVVELKSGGGLVVARRQRTKLPPLSSGVGQQDENDILATNIPTRSDAISTRFAETLRMYEQNPQFRALCGTSAGRLMSLLLALQGHDSNERHTHAAVTKVPELFGSHDGTQFAENHHVPLKQWRRVQGYNNQVWVPAVTLGEGCVVSAEPTYGRPWLAYVDGYFKNRVAAERIFRFGYFGTKDGRRIGGDTSLDFHSVRTRGASTGSALSSDSTNASVGGTTGGQARFLTATTVRASTVGPTASSTAVPMQIHAVRTGQFLARLNSLANIQQEMEERRLRRILATKQSQPSTRENTDARPRSSRIGGGSEVSFHGARKRSTAFADRDAGAGGSPFTHAQRRRTSSRASHTGVVHLPGDTGSDESDGGMYF